MKRVGFIGLGVMGEPMSRHLLKARGEVVVWNRTTTKAYPVKAMGATLANSIEELAEQCEIICTCVNRTEDVLEVVEKAAKTAKPGTLVIDHSTIEPEGAVKIHEFLAGKSLRFVDAPITGGSAGAINGALTIFMGGKHEDVAEAIETCKPYTKKSARVGGPGKGQLMKLANQIAVAGALGGLCECLAFAEKGGLDIDQAKAMIGGGAAGSWAFDNYGPKILNRDWSPGFSVVNQRKDFGYCNAASKSIGAEIPLTMLIDSLLKELEDHGRGEETTAALFDIYTKR